jgi:hypothetical protein
MIEVIWFWALCVRAWAAPSLVTALQLPSASSCQDWLRLGSPARAS